MRRVDSVLNGIRTEEQKFLDMFGGYNRGRLFFFLIVNGNTSSLVELSIPTLRIGFHLS